jgi:hypothetical protein
MASKSFTGPKRIVVWLITQGRCFKYGTKISLIFVVVYNMMYKMPLQNAQMYPGGILSISRTADGISRLFIAQICYSIISVKLYFSSVQ